MEQPASKISDRERFSRLRLLRTDTIGSVTFHALLVRFGSATRAIDHWSSLARRMRKSGMLKLAQLDDIARELEATSAYGSRLIAHDECDYPIALASTDAPPPLITVKGNLELLGRDAVAVVGSRNASATGQRFAREISRELGEAGFVVASGLARGIDTAAHRGSLEHGTIAVMAGGVNVVYPTENARLHAEIGERGLLISEIAFGQSPTAQHFPRRNRIISGLARGVLVVEATLNSGSLITARLAGEQGREVFAVPGSPLDPRARGTNALLRQGAILTESTDDILPILKPGQLLPHSRQCAPKPTICTPDSEQLQREILDRLSRTPVDLDELIRLIGAPPPRISEALVDLEFAGLLTRHPGQKVSLGSQS
ncbi:MAG: DNA-processing protein DprA [Micropepsaceae bacterium]